MEALTAASLASLLILTRRQAARAHRTQAERDRIHFWAGRVSAEVAP